MKISHALRGLVALLLIALQMNLVLPAASAHARLLESTPAAGSTVAAPPPAVTLRFDDALQPGGTVTVTGPGAATTPWSGPATISGQEISAPLTGLGAAGEYTATYRVTSADGHVVTGSTYFTFTGTGAGAPGAEPARADRGLPVLGIAGLVGLGVAVGLLALRRRGRS